MIKKLDHLVITTAKLEDCLSFYRALGFEPREEGGRWALFAGAFKINVHRTGQELEPKATHVQPGSADLCFELDCPLSHGQASLAQAGIAVALGPITRHGTKGTMTSLYLRDPDGNLIELCAYPE